MADVMIATHPTLRCPTCRYLLDGVPLDDRGRITCPECGGFEHASDCACSEPFSFHQRVRRHLLYPILAIFSTALLGSLLPFPLGSLFVMCFAVVLLPIAAFVCLVVTMGKELYLAGRHEKIRVVFWSLAYAFPAVPFIALLVWRYSAIAIHV